MVVLIKSYQTGTQGNRCYCAFKGTAIQGLITNMSIRRAGMTAVEQGPEGQFRRECATAGTGVSKMRRPNATHCVSLRLTASFE
ncbi:hypothetical protein AQS70_11060 [Pseudomonas endophytica]|uniref:Uncharacterized protein n=1 Tax=Pseudomonas endophytica TaxID=1563157 RepID=A0A0N8VSH1_9PSED|nr:hypothetical protein AQS70_11060 [Pseudomonas endophytica]